MPNCCRYDLEQWYFDNYTSLKRDSSSTAVSQAIMLADTVLNFKHPDKYEVHSGNLRGILGEILACKAYDLVTKREYHHNISPRYLDGQGIDIEGRNGVPYPVIGFGVKLSRGGDPLLVSGLPVINIRVREDEFGIPQLIEDQYRGRLVTPDRYMASVFAAPEHRNMLRERLNQQAGRVLGTESAISLDSMKYLKQFRY